MERFGGHTDTDSYSDFGPVRRDLEGGGRRVRQRETRGSGGKVRRDVDLGKRDELQSESRSRSRSPRHRKRGVSRRNLAKTGGEPPSYFRRRPNAPRLSEKHEKYCRCVLHVAADQPEWCVSEGAWEQTRDGETCYNPYAVCTASVGRSGALECFLNYDLDAIPKDEIAGLVELKGKLLRRNNLPHDLRGLKELQKLKEK